MKEDSTNQSNTACQASHLFLLGEGAHHFVCAGFVGDFFAAFVHKAKVGHDGQIAPGVASSKGQEITGKLYVYCCGRLNTKKARAY